MDEKTEPKVAPGVANAVGTAPGVAAESAPTAAGAEVGPEMTTPEALSQAIKSLVQPYTLSKEGKTTPQPKVLLRGGKTTSQPKARSAEEFATEVALRDDPLRRSKYLAEAFMAIKQTTPKARLAKCRAEIRSLKEECSEAKRMASNWKGLVRRVQADFAKYRKESRAKRGRIWRFWLMCVVSFIWTLMGIAIHLKPAGPADIGNYLQPILYHQPGENTEFTVESVTAPLPQTLIRTNHGDFSLIEDSAYGVELEGQLERGELYTTDIFLLYSEYGEFGNDISLIFPEVVPHDRSGLAYLTMAYRDDTQWFAEVKIRSKEDVKIEWVDTKTVSSIVRNSAAVRDYLANCGLDVDDPRYGELLTESSLYHCRIKFMTNAPRQTYTYASSSSSFWCDILLSQTIIWCIFLALICCRQLAESYSDKQDKKHRNDDDDDDLDDD